MEKHAGKIPVNANILIDYTKDKPEVKFDYPNKDIVRQNAGSLVVFGISIVLLVAMISALIFLVLGETAKGPTFCNGTTYSNETTTFPYSVMLECNNGFNYTVDFQYAGLKSRVDNPTLNYLFTTIKPLTVLDVPIKTKFIALLLFVLFLFPGSFIFLHLIMKGVSWFLTRFKWFNDRVPYINDKTSGRMYYKKFESVGESKVLEIPLFHNIRLDYHAHGEFSDYLTKVEIKNHDFEMARWSRKKKAAKKEKNFVLFNCKFYFSEIPKNGSLEVWFK
jgi:hypothetical protein